MAKPSRQDNQTMTTNQAILLLYIYRGSFTGRHIQGTDAQDLHFLMNHGLINETYLEIPKVTTKGSLFVQRLLNTEI